MFSITLSVDWFSGGSFDNQETPDMELIFVGDETCASDSTSGVVADGVTSPENDSLLSIVVVVVFTCVKSDMGEPVKILAKSSSF